MKYQNRIMALPMLCMIIIVLSACCFDEQKNETSNVNPKVQSVETVSVTRGNLTPTVSAHTTIIPALDFVLCSSVEGTFEACSSAGNKITEGGVLHILFQLQDQIFKIPLKWRIFFEKFTILIILWLLPFPCWKR